MTKPRSGFMPSFTALAQTYNTLVNQLVNGAEVYKADSLSDQLQQAATLVVPESSRDAQYFVINGITEPEAYEARFYMMATDTHEKMILGSTDGILLRVDLNIHHGNTNQDEVVVDKEESRGALTVVNRNDTDADGQVDYQAPDGVLKSQAQTGMNGQNEVDLMKLVIQKPLPDYLLNLPSFEDKVTVEIVEGKDRVFFWEDSTKTAMPPRKSQGVYEFTIPNLDDVWIEVTEPSSALGDIKIQLKYKVEGIEGTDIVTATGIWPEVDVREATRNENRVGRNDPRLCEDLSNPYNDDCRTINKLLVWHDSVNDEAITFEVVKTEGNHSPIWVQIKEKGNLNAGTGVWSSCKCKCKLLEQDSELYPSLKVSSNPLVPDSILIGSAVKEIPDSRRDDYFVSDFVIEYGIDYDDLGGLSGEEIKGEYEIFGVTSFDYLEAIRRYDDIYTNAI